MDRDQEERVFQVLDELLQEWYGIGPGNLPRERQKFFKHLLVRLDEAGFAIGEYR